jgi:putative endonuclease
MGAFVYMLHCSDGTYYVGSATGDDLARRIAEHQLGVFRGYTYSRRPVELAWSERFDRITDAIAVKRQLKGRSRAKKEALFGAIGQPFVDYREDGAVVNRTGIRAVALRGISAVTRVFDALWRFAPSASG